jgi:site-specific recombinase XerD
MSTDRLGRLLHAFFEDHLKCQKGLRTNSILSYRDTLRLFLQFVAKDVRHKLTRLTLSDLNAERVHRFLIFLEQERHNQARTRNQRLAALRSFFAYIAFCEPRMLQQAQQVDAIPVKRTVPSQTLYLDLDEIQALFNDLTDEGPFALRDRALLLFLYNTGARAQEISELQVGQLQLDGQPKVRLHGKGDKWRTCPLWHQTAALLRELLAQQATRISADNAVFISRNGQPLTRFGIYKVVRRHTKKLAKKGIDGRLRAISPHVFRHTTAVHLLEAGVEVNVIRAWLGHVSLETTNRYAEITLSMKAEALTACTPSFESSDASHQKVAWRDDPELLQWLQSL